MSTRELSQALKEVRERKLSKILNKIDGLKLFVPKTPHLCKFYFK